MSTYEDLSPYVYDEHDHEGPVLNVGWLGEEPDFPTGDTDPEVVRRLIALASVFFYGTRGYYYCRLCRAEYPIEVPSEHSRRGVIGLGSAEVHVQALDGTVYAAPNLVIHYISDHGYRPPPQFVEAVLGDTAGAYQDRVEAERLSAGR